MKKSFLPLLALVAMASCTQNDMDLKGSPEDQIPILVGANALSIESSTTTRAPFNGPISASDSLYAKVVLTILANGASNVDYSTATSVKDSINFKDVSGTSAPLFGFKTPQYYPVNPDTEVALVGLYPIKADFKPISGETTKYQVTVKGYEDLMVAPEVRTKKANVVTTGTKTYPILNFEHMLTRLDIKAVAKDTASYRAWGKIKQISVIKAGGAALNNQFYVKLTTNVNPVSDLTVIPGNDTIPCYVVGKNSGANNYTDSILNAVKYTKMVTLPVAAKANVATPATDAKEVAYAMIAPFIATSDKTIDLKIVTENGKPETKKINLTLDSSNDGSLNAMRGKKIVITLTFVGTEIVAQATVKNWEAGGTADDTIQ